MKSVMFIAGDPSGDVHAAPIVGELKSRDPHINVWGIGGAHMAGAGLVQTMPFEPFNRMGYAEVMLHLPFFLNAQRQLVKMMASSERPDVLVCVDYSGFNMPMMRAARELNIPVVWYIAPMVWAWKRKRAETLGNLASHIAVIFPFEEQYFSPYSAPVTFVGNPLVESLSTKTTSLKKFPQDGNFRIAIVPGSRPQEIKNMLGVMARAANALKKKYPQIKVSVSKFGKSNESLFKNAKERGFEIFSGLLSDLLLKSDLALITSGTATLESALLGVPAVIAYRTSPISYAVYKHFVKIKHIGLPNIIADESIVPECIQENANPQNLFNEMDKFMSSPPYWEETVKKLFALKYRLGEKKPSIEVADIVYSLFNGV